MPILLCFLAFSAIAEEGLEDLLNMSLDELADYQVITATKTELRLADSPGSISIITRDQIDRSPSTSIPELLRNVAGVNVRWNPMVQTIGVRSFGSNPFTSQVLLLIDGVPYNSWNKGGFPQHPGFDFFNLDIVKHIEVMRGSGSSLYGENAFNGVVNIITLDGTEKSTSRVRYEQGSLSHQNLSGSISHNFGEERSVFGALRYTQGRIPTDLWLDDAQGDAKGYDLYLKSKFEQFKFSYYRRDDRFRGYEHAVEDGFPPGTFFRSAPKIEQQVNILAAGYTETIDSIGSKASVNFSYANRDGSHCAACHARDERETFSESEDHGYQLFANAQLDTELGSFHKLSTGVEWRKISSGGHSVELHGADHNAAEAVAGHEDSVQKYSKHAVFIQDQWETLSNRLSLTAGLRYESATSPDLFPDRWFPRMSGVYRVNEGLTLRGSWHRAARYPSFSELYQDSSFLSAETPFGNIELSRFEPNLELQPESIESFELGVDLRVGGNLQGSLALFRNKVEDSIIIAYPKITFENHPGDARVQGLELQVRNQPFEWLELSMNWSLQNNKQTSPGLDSGGSPLEFTYAPKHKVNLLVSAMPSNHLTATLEVNWKSETLAPSFWYPIALGVPEQTPLNSFAYVNTKMVYQPRVLLRNGERPLTVSLALRNLLNERPYETLTGFGGRNAGRSGYVGIEYRWGGK